MSYVYFILGVIGWTIAPVVIVAFAFWPTEKRCGFDVLPRDSKQNLFQ